MYEWVKLQGRSGRFLLNAVALAALVGGYLYVRATETADDVTLSETIPSSDRDGTGLVVLTMLTVLIAIGWFGSTFRLVKVDDCGFTEVGLPWRRVCWRDVTAIELASGLFLNYVVVSRGPGASEVWLTRSPLMIFRTPDLEEETLTLVRYWEDWRQRNPTREDSTTQSDQD